MKKNTKKVLTIVVVLLSFVLTIFLDVYFLFLHRYHGQDIAFEWNSSDEFDINSIKTVNKQKDKDFVILNLADVQICDISNIYEIMTIKNEIEYLVEKTKPDLITLTGDQTWSNENFLSLSSLINWLDNLKIPYAPVFGNHDYGNEKDSAVLNQKACCDLYEQGKYSLFSRGPSNLGTLGNYVINIMEGDKIYRTLYMLDSGYEDEITDQQIAWFVWNAEGIKKANNNEYSEGMCFMHKPIPEYATAYRHYYYDMPDVEVINDVHVHFSLYGSMQNGFFEQAKIRNVKDVVCGHQHGNNFTIKYEGVRLTFALKTGETMSYYNDGVINLTGATYFVLNNSGTTVKNWYMEPDQFHIQGSDNIYER